MRSRVLAAGAAALAVALAACTVPSPVSPVPAAQSPAQSPVPSSVPSSSDLLRPSDRPVTLRSDPRPLSVTYALRGERRTLDDFLTRTRANGFLVLDERRIVYERYQGADRETRFQSWSLAKSFTSAAIGIALGEGRIRSIDDPVTRYLPELQGSGYDGVSIRNLLRMSSGIEWNERHDVPRMQVATRRGLSLRSMAARQVRGWEPGSRFEYTSMNSFVLARVVTEATGMPYHRYVEEKIWKAAGMEATAWLDDDLGYCCYYATDRDFARFGLLYLHGGLSQGRQVVPPSWVVESTRPSASFNPQYGLHWWLGGGGQDDFMAAGFGGQYIYVSPAHGVVIVKSSFARATTSDAERDEALAVFRAVAAEVARTR